MSEVSANRSGDLAGEILPGQFLAKYFADVWSASVPVHRVPAQLFKFTSPAGESACVGGTVAVAGASAGNSRACTCRVASPNLSNDSRSRKDTFLLRQHKKAADLFPERA